VNATEHGWSSETYNNSKNMKEKDEDAERHISCERPEWTPRCLGEAG